MIPTLLAVTISASVSCTNENYTYSPRCTSPIAEFHIEHNRFYGTLESGVEWEQRVITSSIHEFKMEDVHWFVINGEIVYPSVVK